MRTRLAACSGRPRRRLTAATGCRASRSPGSISGSAISRCGPATWTRPSGSSTQGSGSHRVTTGCSAHWPGCTRCGTNGASATDAGEQAIAQALDPATLGVLTDAYTALGDTTKAAEYYHAMALAVLRQPGPYHRAWSLFLLDHDREVPRVLAKVRG